MGVISEHSFIESKAGELRAVHGFIEIFRFVVTRSRYVQTDVAHDP